MNVIWLFSFMVSATGVAANLYMYMTHDGGAVSVAAMVFCGALAIWALVQSAVTR